MLVPSCKHHSQGHGCPCCPLTPCALDRPWSFPGWPSTWIGEHIELSFQWQPSADPMALPYLKNNKTCILKQCAVHSSPRGRGSGGAGSWKTQLRLRGEPVGELLLLLPPRGDLHLSKCGARCRNPSVNCGHNWAPGPQRRMVPLLMTPSDCQSVGQRGAHLRLEDQNRLPGTWGGGTCESDGKRLRQTACQALRARKGLVP